MVNNVFVYGTLLFDEIIKSVIYRVPEYRMAKAHGFKRYKISKRLYPGALATNLKSDILHGRVQNLHLYAITNITLNI